MHTKSKGQSIGTLCGLFGKTRQAYYQQKNRVISEAFESEVVSLFPQLELKERINHIRDMLAKYLPDDYREATINSSCSSIFFVLATFGRLSIGLCL